MSVVNLLKNEVIKEPITVAANSVMNQSQLEAMTGDPAVTREMSRDCFWWWPVWPKKSLRWLIFKKKTANTFIKATWLSRKRNKFYFRCVSLHYFCRGDKVLAVGSMGPGNAVAKAANDMFEGKMRSASEIRLVNILHITAVRCTL